LSVCSSYHDDATYLAEWIEFHRAVGVERFFLYNNHSTDDHETVLKPYVEAGIAEVTDWPVPIQAYGHTAAGLIRAFDDCIGRHRHDTRWMAFLDVDEFLFSPSGRPLPEVLSGYERWPGVCVSRAEYGTSGHRTRPPGLVIESFVHRLKTGPDATGEWKSVVDPTRVSHSLSHAHFFYLDGIPVNENRGSVRKLFRPGKISTSFTRLRVNHYRTKSEEELERKMGLWTKAIGAERPDLLPRARFNPNLYELDDTITMYAPAVREALASAS
jgi:hypothetical protein